MYQAAEVMLADQSNSWCVSDAFYP